MRILLLDNIKNVGKLGEITIVKKGFANNYLFPLKKAIRISSNNINKLKNTQKIISLDYKEENIKEINNLTLIINKKIKKNNEIYGVIDNKYIINILKKLNFKINKNNISTKIFIKKIGTHEISIIYPKIHTEAKIHLMVKAL